MKHVFLKTAGLLACAGLLSLSAVSQQNNGKLRDNEEIIIRKKGDKDAKVTVEIKDGEVKVNGKPLSEFNDGNVEILKGRDMEDGADARAFVAPRSPFRGGTLSFNNLEFRGDPNKAFLGVASEKVENGARITSVSKGSAAEKAGLKAGDIITGINDTKIAGPDDLTVTVGSMKAGDKVTINYKRDKKDQKSSIELGRRALASTFGPNFNFDRNDMDLHLSPPGADAYSFNFRGGGPRLGIKAQDTEDGKGAKVLGVDDESNAQKAGVKEGDVITEFDGKPVNSAMTLADAAKDAREKSSVKIKVNRNGQTQDIEIKIPKKLKTASL